MEIVNNGKQSIGDGDSKSYSSIKAGKPYGDKTIAKIECVRHVQKRMGTTLRKLKVQKGKTKLADGKSIGGVSRLTAARIDKLQVYYELAIRRHKNNVDAMKNEVWAGLYHSASTEENPQHQNCPAGQVTWCKYNKAMLQIKLFKHKNPLPTAILDEIRPIYKKLTNDDIMNGCLGNYTQNSCEAINHLIWSRCPKISHSGRDHLDATVAAAVVAFNDGSSGLARVLSHVGINPGSNMLLGLSARDCKRKRESDINASIVAKKKGQSRRKKKKVLRTVFLIRREFCMRQGPSKDDFKHFMLVFLFTNV